MAQSLTQEFNLDIRPAANLAFQKIEQAHEDAKKAKKPLVVLMGESHHCPTHRMVRQLVMQKLSDEDYKFGYGVEYEWNYYPQDHQAFLADRKGEKSLDVSQRNRFFDCANQSFKNTLSFIADKKIPFRPNDTGRKYQDDKIICVPPPIAEFENSPKDLDAQCPDGMYLRNQVIVRHAMDHLGKLGNDYFYIQHCGSAHIFGDKPEALPYEQSLSALFEQAGAQTLMVVPELAYFTKDNILQDMPMDQQGKIIWLKDLFQGTVTYEKTKLNDFTKGWFNDYGIQNESHLLQIMSEESGGEIKLYNKKQGCFESLFKKIIAPLCGL
jgi:hypothetical protein